MSELGPDLQALLDAARGGDDPTAADRARVKAALGAQLGPAAFAAQVPLAGARSPWLRIGAGAAAIGVAVLAGLMIHRASATNPPPAPPAPPPVALEPEPTKLATGTQAAPLDPPSIPVESLHAVPQAQPQSTIAKAAPAADESTLERELLLLKQAKSALDQGDADKALGVLDQHEKTFPSGVLAEERGATRVLALCAAGRTAEAKSSAKDFLARYPRSPSAVRVRASCGAP